MKNNFIRVDGVAVRLQGNEILHDLSWTIGAGEQWAILGPNGSGKSTVLAAAGCAYSSAYPREFFFTSIVGDQQIFRWEIDFDLIDKDLSPKDVVRGKVTITKESWELFPQAERDVKYFGIHRTLPAATNPFFMRKYLGGRAAATK